MPRLQRFAAELPYELEQTAYRWTNWALRLPDETSRFAQRAATGFGGPVYTTAPVFVPPYGNVPPEGAPCPEPWAGY